MTALGAINSTTDITTGTTLLAANNLSDVANVASSRTSLGLGTMATQNSSSVNITGGTISGISGFAQVLSTTTGIDGTAMGTTDLYTVPASKKAICIAAIVRVTAVSALIGVGTGGIGTNATQDNIFGSRALTGLADTTTAFIYMNPNLFFTLADAGEIIKLGIDVAFTAGSVTLAIDLIGYLI